MLAVLGAAACVLAGPASATGTSYRVQIGSLPAGAGPQPLTATSTTVIVWGFGDVTMNCTSSFIATNSGSTVTNSPTANVLDLMSIARLTFSGCTLGSTSFTFTQAGSMSMHGTGGVTAGSTDQVAGHLDSVAFEAKDASTSGSICRFRVAGRASMSFREGTRSLSVSETGSTGELHVSNVVGCGGAISAGDIVRLTGSYRLKITSNDLAVNIRP